MKIYKVTYNSFEGNNTEIFFCNKAEAKKWIREQKKHALEVLNNPDDDGCTAFYDYVDGEPTLLHLKSTKKRDIVDFINENIEKP